MKKIIHQILTGKQEKPVTFDFYYDEKNKKKPLVIFAHGFKGFKDWGHWQKIGEAFVNEGFNFLKFNFSHNGTTVDQPLDFADLEAFGQNNYTKELEDVQVVLDWVESQKTSPLNEVIDHAQIFIIGHSRGGPIALLTAIQDHRIKGLITWASVSHLNYSWQVQPFLIHWKQEGVIYIKNGRTGQEMPLYFQLVEDYQANEDRLNVEKSAKNFTKPQLILHGTKDPAVSLDAAKELKKWNPNAQLFFIENADHVFGGRHPFLLEELPKHSQEIVQLTSQFIQQHSSN